MEYRYKHHPIYDTLRPSLNSRQTIPSCTYLIHRSFSNQLSSQSLGNTLAQSVLCPRVHKVSPQLHFSESCFQRLISQFCGRVVHTRIPVHSPRTSTHCIRCWHQCLRCLYPPCNVFPRLVASNHPIQILCV